MRGLTTIQILLRFLRSRLPPGSNSLLIATHEIELDASTFGREIIGITHNPQTYGRVWRILKAHASEYGLRIVDYSAEGDEEVTWRVEFVNMPFGTHPNAGT